MVGRVLAEACSATQQGHQEKGVSARDLVLWKAVGNARDVGSRKLASNWEGSFRATAIARAGAYYLEEMEDRPLP